MTYTDDAFIEAMRQAPKIKGDMHQAPGRYMGEGGSGFCILGHCLGALGLAIPRNNEMLGYELMMHHGASSKVAVAAYVAQFVNDMNIGWKWVVEAFDEALALNIVCPTVASAHYISNQDDVRVILSRAQTRYYEAREAERRKYVSDVVQTYKAKPQDEAVKVPKVPVMATGGYIASTDQFATITNSISQITVSLHDIKVPAVDFSSLFVKQGTVMLAKKDHALVA